MGNIALAIEQVVKKVLANLDMLVVNRIRSNARHDLVIENGAGAYVKLVGDEVLINGLTAGGGNTFDIIYFGSDHLCWICRDAVTGDLVFHTPPNKGFLFEGGVSSANNTLIATEAVYVDNANPDTNFATSHAMYITTTPISDAFILFDTSSITMPVLSATLRLYNVLVGQTGTSYLTFSQTLEEFDQATVTWNNQPIYITHAIGSAFSFANSGAVGWIEFDVTELMNESNGVYFGLNIKRSSGLEARFSSKSGNNPPQLVLVVSA